jgi:hypothetical protein
VRLVNPTGTAWSTRQARGVAFYALVPGALDVLARVRSATDVPGALSGVSTALA